MVSRVLRTDVVAGEEPSWNALLSELRRIFIEGRLTVSPSTPFIKPSGLAFPSSYCLRLIELLWKVELGRKDTLELPVLALYHLATLLIR